MSGRTRPDESTSNTESIYKHTDRGDHARMGRKRYPAPAVVLIALGADESSGDSRLLAQLRAMDNRSILAINFPLFNRDIQMLLN
jgi:hypothetical protein